MGINPFAVRVNDNEQHFPIHWASMVHVKSSPPLFWPFLGLNWYFWWILSVALAQKALSYSFLQVIVEAWPPNIAPCEALHSANAWVTFVVLIHDF